MDTWNWIQDELMRWMEAGFDLSRAFAMVDLDLRTEWVDAPQE